MSKLGQESIFPIIEKVYCGEYVGIRLKDPKTVDLEPENYRQVSFDKHIPGMSKRFYAVCSIIQGIMAGGVKTNTSYKEVVSTAYGITDELLKQEMND
jgi:hypothetical protein